MAKDGFLAVLSHELRTPLSAMLGWCQMLREGSVPADRTTHALRVIERNALAQLRLIEDLLDVSRIVVGKLSWTCNVPIVAIVRAAIESIQPVAAAKGVGLSIDVGRDVAPTVDACAAIRAACSRRPWGTCCPNAIKFTPRSGDVPCPRREAGRVGRRDCGSRHGRS